MMKLELISWEKEQGEMVEVSERLLLRVTAGPPAAKTWGAPWVV